MQPQPFFGVFLHALGGLAAGSFYLPYKKVRGWAWELYWLVGGVFSWIGDDNAELQLEGQALFASELQFHPQFAPGFGRVELISAPTP